MLSILVAEDDPDLRELFCVVLEGRGFSAHPAANGDDALEVLDEHVIDLIVTDAMMPKMDGFELASEVRAAYPEMPILMITVKGTLADKREGFGSGVDDYMVKPIDVNEMVLRVEALFRRSRINTKHRLEIGSTVLNRNDLTVECDGAVSELPQKEFFLLFKLLASPNRIFTRLQIMDDVWGMDSDADPHTIEVHVSRLRERFKHNKDFEIVTVRGLGYKAVILDES